MERCFVSLKDGLGLPIFLVLFPSIMFGRWEAKEIPINILCTCATFRSLLSEPEFTMFARAGGIILFGPIFFLRVLIGEDGLSLQLLWGLVPSHSLEVLTITSRSVTRGPLSLT